MNTELSDNTKAILLLTAPLIVGKGEVAVRLLTLSEYNKLARRLSESGSEPADLLRMGWEEALSEWQPGFDIKRIGRLLERGFLLSQAIERWQARAIWVVSRADAQYPERLKKRLGGTAPPVLYGCGDPSLLENGGLAVVGSRKVNDELIEYAESIGRLAATSGFTIVSGAARGVDQAAMHGAFKGSGTVTGVLTGDLEREAMNREHREMLVDGLLALISPYDPKAGFNVANAMQRNKLIYALADAGLVIDSGHGEGGTWAGAVEQLDKLHFVPVYARSQGEISVGLKALRQKGALVWPNPETPDELKVVLSGNSLHSKMEAPRQGALMPAVEDIIEPHDNGAAEREMPSIIPSERNDVEEVFPAVALFTKVEQLLKAIDTPITESDVTKYLQIEKGQAKAWLKRLVDEGKYRRLNRPVRYTRIF